MVVLESLFELADRCLKERDPLCKVQRTAESVEAWRIGLLSLRDFPAVQPIATPGRPERPLLVPPRALPRRKPTTLKGRAALIHALAHIELNAINLAWDAVYRFRGLPRTYYDDWVQVAGEEAHHFTLLMNHLGDLGWSYGDFPAHDGLWEMARDTADSPLHRMALVPRTLEARGLDVTPGIMQRLADAGDWRAVEILEVIQRDEVGHVAVGSRWFKYLCAQQAVDPQATYHALLDRYLRGQMRGPFNRQARLASGFSEQELDALEAREGRCAPAADD
jgi:uncharacterized ferritin-like protein (DUF455 family)